jgi:hypothetical protein
MCLSFFLIAESTAARHAGEETADIASACLSASGRDAETRG